VVRFSVYRNGRTPDDGGSDKSYPLEYEEALAELMELLMRGHYLSEMSEKERRIVLKLGEGSSAERSYFYADDMLDFFFLEKLVVWKSGHDVQVMTMTHTTGVEHPEEKPSRVH